MLFGDLSEITLFRTGQPDLHMAGTERATFKTLDAGQSWSGEIHLRRR